MGILLRSPLRQEYRDVPINATGVFKPFSRTDSSTALTSEDLQRTINKNLTERRRNHGVKTFRSEALQSVKLSHSTG
ncbi:hypothetical protein [Mechercharimyces sp. CAU 1602]|uniref:hypothetical protein n=1 Tax=Mechercharimyces sp. CAU 1602 TaxID=2973933 RepID=UPI0021629734|nr:hypothetical protein [Mechercharimyces sp. CAU 1602]MCS1350302.1 hypothetical protein [Mechercharimyces sp. CAU 1602]